LFVQIHKNIPNLFTVEESQTALSLYKRVVVQEDTATPHPVSEHAYLTQYYTAMKGLSNFSGQVVRLLYSDRSRVLSIHLIDLAPFSQFKEPPSIDKANLGQQHPVFLQRNVDRMRTVRGDTVDAEMIEVENGLVSR
jgi:hypothetical protein